MLAQTSRVCAALIGIAIGCIAAADPTPTFTQHNNFPPSTAFGVVADSLGDGRFIVYDGDGIWIQDAVNTDAYSQAATGYAGDPALLAVSPDGHTCLIGAGFSGSLWLFDADAPVNAGAPIFTSGSDFWAEWISTTQVIVDRAVFVGPGMFDFAAELNLIDISGTPIVREVVSNKGGASAMCVLDSATQRLFAADGLTGTTKSVAVADLVTAFDTSTPIDWATLPTLGTYNTGGPGAITPERTLIFGGFGTVEFVSADTGASLDVHDPAGTSSFSYLVGYNDTTGRVVVTGSQFFPSFETRGYVSDVAFETLPIGGGFAMALVFTLVLALGLRNLKRQPISQ